MNNDQLENPKTETSTLGTEKYLNAHPSFISNLYSQLSHPLTQLKSSRYRKFIYYTLGFTALIIPVLIGFFVSGRGPAKPPKIVSAPTNSFYMYETSNKEFSAKIGNKNSTSPYVSFSSPTGTSATFSMVGSQSRSAKQEGNSIVYENVLPDTTVSYTSLPNGIKEEIIIGSRVTKPEYTFSLNTTAHPRQITTGYYSPYFFDDNNTYQFHMEKPFAVDANGNRTEDISLSLRQSKENKNSYQILVSVSPEWLSSKDRAFPVTVDPTIVHDTSAEFAAGVLNRVKDTGSGSFPSLETFYQELPADQSTAGLWHMNETADNTCTGGSNDACDSSGNTLDGASTATSISTSNPRLGAAARSFNGTSSFLLLPASAKLDLQRLTIEAWVYSSNFAQNGFVFEKTTNGSVNTQYSCFFETASGIVFRTINTSSTSDSLSVTLANSGIANNAWNHLACVYDGSTKKIYVNGREVASSVYSQTLQTNSAGTAIIGAYGSGAAYFFNGLIDEVRVSNVARTSEEIRLDAQRRPYSVFTSDVIDFGTLIYTWSPLTWTEVGVKTGDGETLKDATSLVAQWDMNETSGTTASVTAGSCGSSCNGTLTNMTTSGQDAAPVSGWTSDNRRWGAGAVMFDGTNDTIVIGSESTFDFERTNSFSLAAWVKTSSANNQAIFSKMANSSPFTGYELLTLTTGNVRFQIINTNTTNAITIDSDKKINDGQWHYVVTTYDGSSTAAGTALYIDGENINTVVYNNLSASVLNNISLYLGSRNNSTIFFNGVIDSALVFSRVLTPIEIMSNYNAGNVEIQTRVGSDATPDDGDWEEWRPVTAETVIDNMDNPLDYATPSASIFVGSLISTSSATFPIIEGTHSLKIQTGQQSSLNNVAALWHFEETGGTGAYIKDSGPSGNNGTPSNTTSANGILGKARSFSSGNYITVPDSASLKPSTITISAWINTTNTSTQMIVMKYNPVTPFQGYALNVNGLVANKPSCWVGGTTWTTGSTSVNDGRWHHIACTNDGTNTRVYVDGILDGSLAQTPTLSYAIQLTIGGINGTGNFIGKIDELSISSAVKSPEEIAELFRLGRGYFINKTISSTDLSGKNLLPFYIASDRPGTYLQSTAGESGFANYQPDSSTKGLWHLDENDGWTLLATLTDNGAASPNLIGSSIPFTAVRAECSDGTNQSIANFDTPQVANTTTGLTSSNGKKVMLGGAGQYGIYNTSQNACSWSSDNGMVGSGFDGTNCGTYNTNLKVGVGNDADATLDIRCNVNIYVKNGSGVSKDSSGNGNHGTLEGTTFTQGVIGRARSFNGISDNITLANESNFDFERTNSFTLEAWIRTSSTNQQSIISKQDSSSPFSGWILRVNPTTGALGFVLTNTVTTNQINVSTNAAISDGKWHYVVATYAGTSLASGVTLYIDGISQAVTVNVNNLSATTLNNIVPSIGSRNNVDTFFSGSIDEVRISNVVRTADQIRQTFESGFRSHNITIDFAASLDSGNLITGSGDLSFTVDATAFGLSSKGDKLYKGDKIIIRENVDGTEYLAQGTVNAITVSTGATTVASWDTGSTFPSGGFTVNASVFKWQREYWDISEPLDTHLNAVTNLTLRVTDGNEGRSIWLDDLRSAGDYLTDPNGSTITSSIGNRYAQYRAVIHSFDEALTATLAGVTLDYVPNTAPNTPTLDLPLDTAISIPISGQQLKTTATDTNSDYLQYKIELCTNLAMTTNCQTFDQTSSQTGWSGQNTQSGTAYTSGTQATYTLQTSLTIGTTYYWRSYAIDPGGTNTFGNTQSPPHSFTTNAKPAIPTLDSPADTATGVLLSPTLQTTGTDADSDYLRYKIELCTNLAMTTNCQTFDQTSSQTGWSGQNTQSGTAYTSGTQASYTIQTPLLPYTNYYWRSSAIDPAGANTFGNTQATPFSFTTNKSPEIPSLDVPADTATGVSVTPTLQTTGTDLDGDFLKYKIQICTDLNMALNCQTFDQTVTQTGWSGQNTQSGTAYTSATQASYTLQSPLTANIKYFWRSSAIDPAGTNFFGSTQTVPFSFTTMPNPAQASSCRVEKNSANTQIIVRWNDNSTVEDGYQIWKVTDGGAPAHITPDLAPNTTTYTDTNIVSNHTYGYLIRSYQIVGANTLYSTFCPTATSSLFTGGFTIF